MQLSHLLPNLGTEGIEGSNLFEKTERFGFILGIGYRSRSRE